MRQCVFGILSLFLLQAQTCAPVPLPPDEFGSFQDEVFEPEATLSVEETVGGPEIVQYRLAAAIVGAGTLYEYDTELKARRDLYEFYDAGNTAKPTALADPGHVFSHWEGDATGTNGYIEIAMDSDRAITAVFVEVAQLKMDVVGEGNMDLPSLLHFTVGSESVGFGDRFGYAVGSEVTVTAVPDTGWRFVRWEKRSGVLFGATVEWDAASETTTDAALTLVWGGPTKLTVVFEEDLTPIYTQAEIVHFLSILWDKFAVLKWEGNIRFTTSGSPTSEDLVELSKIVNEINSIFESAGTTVRMSLDSFDPNFEVVFEPLDGTIVSGGPLWGYVSWIGDWAEAHIQSQIITQKTRNTVLRHEIMHALGFLHSQNTSSIMFPILRELQQTFPSIDRTAIEILYNPRLRIGMPMADALAALNPLVIGGTGSISARVLPNIEVEGGFCGCSQ